MGVSYKKLFKLMNDRDMIKKDLKEMASIGDSTMTKLAKDENVTMYYGLIIEILPDEETMK